MLVRHDLAEMRARALEITRVIGERQLLDSIGMQRLEPAIIFPGTAETGIVEKLPERQLVIALQEDAFETGCEIAGQPVDHGPGLQPAIDVIPQKNQDLARPRRGGGGIGLDQAQKRGQQIVAAVNIADRIDPHAVRRARHHGRRAAEHAPQPIEDPARHQPPRSRSARHYPLCLQKQGDSNRNPGRPRRLLPDRTAPRIGARHSMIYRKAELRRRRLAARPQSHRRRRSSGLGTADAFAGNRRT